MCRHLAWLFCFWNLRVIRYPLYPQPRNMTLFMQRLRFGRRFRKNATYVPAYDLAIVFFWNLSKNCFTPPIVYRGIWLSVHAPGVYVLIDGSDKTPHMCRRLTWKRHICDGVWPACFLFFFSTWEELGTLSTLYRGAWLICLCLRIWSIIPTKRPVCTGIWPRVLFSFTRPCLSFPSALRGILNLCMWRHLT